MNLHIVLCILKHVPWVLKTYLNCNWNIYNCSMQVVIILCMMKLYCVCFVYVTVLLYMLCLCSTSCDFAVNVVCVVNVKFIYLLSMFSKNCVVLHMLHLCYTYCACVVFVVFMLYMLPLCCTFWFCCKCCDLAVFFVCLCCTWLYCTLCWTCCICAAHFVLFWFQLAVSYLGVGFSGSTYNTDLG